MIDATAEFLITCEDQGLRPEKITGDGELHRCPVEGKAHGLDGAYVLHQDPPASGWWKNYRTGNEDTWTTASSNDHSMSPEDRARLRARIKADQKAQREAQAKRHAEAAAEAASILTEAPDCPTDHPYLKAKSVPTYPGLKLSRDGRIIVPVLDATGKPVSLQFIADDGGKRFLTGGRIAGGFFAIKGNDGPLYIAEGYATAATIHEATGATVLAAFNAGNLLAVAKLARTMYPKRPIVLGADDDRRTDGNPGVTKATEAAQAINGAVVVPRLPDGAEGSDFNDLANVVGLPAVEEQLVQIPGKDTEAQPRPGLRLVPLNELLSAPRPAEWLLRDYLEAQSLACLFGASGSMKTFVALDMALSIAAGIPWHGVAVPNGGPVVYVAGEGFRGLSKRVRAWLLDHDMLSQDIPFFVASSGVHVRDPESLAETISAIEALSKQHGKPRLIVLDTLARTFGPGDENSTQDMGGFIARVDEVRRQFECAILIVHHTGLAERDRARGAYAFTAALDWSYRLDVRDDTRVLTCTKAKDFEPPTDIAFSPEPTDTGWADDETGEPIYSVVLHETDMPQKKPKTLSGAKQIALDALHKACGDDGRAHIERWREVAYRSGITPSQDFSAKRKAFSRAVSSLKASGLIEVENDYYWPAGQEGQAGQNGTCPAPVPCPERDITGHTPLRGVPLSRLTGPKNDSTSKEEKTTDEFPILNAMEV